MIEAFSQNCHLRNKRLVGRAHLEDGLHASWITHGLGGVVGVGSGSIPVALDRLGVERANDAKVLTQPRGIRGNNIIYNQVGINS